MMIEDNEISYGTDGSVGTVILQTDTLSISGITALTDVLRSPGCEVLVLTSSGPDFCRGRSPGSRPTSAEQARREVLDPIIGLYRAFGDASCTVVSAVTGQCLGLGFALALSADVVVCEPGASFSLPERRAGFPPLLAMSQLSGIIPAAALTHLALSAEPITARDLAAMGAVAVLAPAEDLPAVVEQRAAHLAEQGSVSRQTVEFTRRQLTAQRRENFDVARQVLGEVLGSPTGG
uniref:Enoyl-CoA hydratase/isomerase n=1 Tax=Mycolicibacterium brisbanense TaxID=146020 RepID=B8R4J3_9MYCO|nr:hypothetical protein [Mycolicibacterium brisbanense]